MSREWKPGDVAMVLATFGPKDNAPSEYVVSRNADGWTLLSDRDEHWLDGNDDYDCKAIRPLVVIDPEDREAVERLLDGWWTRGGFGGGDVGVDNLQAALREYANPKPPKPDEPQGLGAVVEDEDGNPWVKTLPGRDDDAYEWIAGFPSDPKLVSYADISAVRVLSPGVEVDQ